METAAKIEAQLNNPASPPALSIEQKTANALQEIAGYFSAQFPLTQKTQTTVGWLFSYIPFSSSASYQGLYTSHAVTQNFTAAANSFEKAKSAINAVLADNLDEHAQKQLTATLKQLESQAPGRRFPHALSAWLDLFINASVQDAKAFITESQRIFKKHATADVSRDLTTLSDQDASAAYVQGQSFFSLFEAMEAIATHVPNHRPSGIQDAKDDDFLMAALLSTTARQPKPSREQSLRTLYAILNLYPHLHQVLFREAAKSATSEPPTNFRLHCAMMQTVLTTLSVQSHTIPETLEVHWKENNSLRTDPTSLVFNKHTFEKARFNLIQFSIEGHLFNREKFNEHLPGFMEGNSDARQSLICVLLQYIDALSAQLQQALNQHARATDVKNAFNPDLAQELLQAMRLYINSAAFKASLGITDEPELVEGPASETPTAQADQPDAAAGAPTTEVTDNNPAATDESAAVSGASTTEVTDNNPAPTDTSAASQGATDAVTPAPETTPAAKPTFGDQDLLAQPLSGQSSAASSPVLPTHTMNTVRMRATVPANTSGGAPHPSSINPTFKSKKNEAKDGVNLELILGLGLVAILLLAAFSRSGPSSVNAIRMRK